jgi:hypothetical protein
MKRFHTPYTDFMRIPVKLRRELFFDELEVLKKETEKTEK